MDEELEAFSKQQLIEEVKSCEAVFVNTAIAQARNYAGTTRNFGTCCLKKQNPKYPFPNGRIFLKAALYTGSRLKT